jgi:membrane protein involved in colicin uptake
MSSNPTKSEATNAETTKNPKEGSDWLGGPQNGDEIPGNGGNGGNGGNASGSGNGGNGDATKVGSAYWQF